MTQHLLVAHGSPDPRHRQAVSTLADALSRLGLPTEAAYLEQDAPSVEGWLDGRSGRVVTLGLFLAPGHHVRVDLPRVLAAAPDAVDIDDRGALAVGPWLVPVLEDLVAQVAAPDAAVVLVSAGSARTEAQIALEQFAATWAKQRSASVALVHSPQELATSTPPGAVVVPLMIAPGVLADRVRVAADAAGARCTPTLSQSPCFTDVVAARLTGEPARVSPGYRTANATSRDRAR